MASRTAAVAEGVKLALNEAAADADAFGAIFVAKRVYAPFEKLEAQRDLVVTVWCPGDTMSQATRGSRDYDIPVLVAVQKHLTQDAGDGSTEASNPELDGLMEIAERVSDFFTPDSPKVGGALWQASELTLGNVDKIRESRQFFAIATIRFTLHKKD